ncbi:hypothetical protein KC330_g7741 [Hortaea werneckii]|nr:hypothetical protein KC330_g7741 [Hortaea werneckii]
MAESDTHNSRSPKGSPAPSDFSDVASQEHHSFFGPQSQDDIELDSIDACSHRSSSSRTSSETPREHHSSLSYAPLEQSAPVSPKVAAQADAFVDKAIDDEESGLPPSTRLKRSIYKISMDLVHTGLALFTWITLCIQSTRPITTESYGLNVLKEKVNYDFTSVGGIYPKASPYVRNEEYFQRARVIQALNNVLTIYLTSALCSKAAVAFVRRKASVGLSMRKLTIMADRGWTDRETILKALLGGWQKYASSFLVFAILLNVLGAEKEIPVISRTGMVLISILLGLDLTRLLGLAIYSSLTPTRTNQFDALAMMRLGAAIHEKVPLHVFYSHSQVKVLDTTSGFVGDGPEETSNGSIRQLTLGNALSQSHSKASPVLKPSSLKTDSSVQSTPLHSPNPHHQRKDSNSLQPSPAVSHRSSFAENLRTYPPSPRAQRHQSFSGQALTELLMHPPVKGSGDDARFKGRDWRNIQISEIIEPAETRFVELSSSIEATTKLLIKSGAPNVVLIRESTKTKTAISTFDFSDLNAYLLLVLGLSQPDDLAGKLAERARSGEAIPLSDAMDHLRAREEPAFLPHTATLTRAMEVLGGGAHRVLINKEGSSETIGILTQLRLVRFFWENHKNFAATEALYARSLKDLQLGAKEVLAINGDKPLSDALRLMHDEGITSLPVLDSHSNVVGNISHVDVRLLTDTSSIPLLSSSCIHFISVILSERGLADGKDSFPVFHVAPFSTLAHTVAKLCATRSHRMWIVDAPSPSTTVPPSPAVHSNTQPINIEHGAPHLPAPAAHMASPPKSTAGSDMTPGPPFTSINPGVTISASQLPGAAMSGRLSGVVSLTDILNLFARASGLHPGDPEEMRKLRRRSSSSSSRPNIDSVRASAEYMRSSVELGRSSSTSSRR